MLPDLMLQQRVSDGYTRIYKRIDGDVNDDLELIFKYLTKVSEDVDWYDDDIFNKVLEMRDQAIRLTKRIKIPKENPKWERMYKILKRAAVRGKTTGVFKVEEYDCVPFYKKLIKAGDQIIKVDPDLI